jgi:hypothetical protein
MKRPKIKIIEQYKHAKGQHRFAVFVSSWPAGDVYCNAGKFYDVEGAKREAKDLGRRIAKRVRKIKAKATKK